MDSQASKHLDWCINKANREIEDSKKQGKKPRHRGILKTEQNPNLALMHLRKAQHNLEVLRIMK